MRSFRLAVALTLALGAPGCSGSGGGVVDDPTPDIGTSTPDAGSGAEDAAASHPDAGAGADDVLEPGPDTLSPDDVLSDVAPDGALDAAPDVPEDVGSDIEEDVPDGVFFPNEGLEAAPGWFYQVHLPAVPLDHEGESPELYVDLPEGTTGAFVMVGGEDIGFFTLKKVITPPPLNQQVVKGPGGHICIPCENRVVSAQQVASFLVPNDPSIEVKGGEWTFKVHATEVVKWFGETTWVNHTDALCDVLILARTGDPPEVGRVALHLHFTGSDGLSALAAPTDERLQAGLDGLVALFATAGLEIEVAGYHDVPGVEEDPTLTQIGSTLGSPNDLAKLFLTGQTDDPVALNVFFVESIFKDIDYEQIGGTVLGVSGGVPGPAFLGATFRGGVAIATFELGGRVDFFGNVMAHEIGHYLGLFHSTEKDAIFHDTLEDTPEDDGANLMFWAWSAEATTVTPDQAAILRSHPLVMPVTDR